jgi:hypothetical protein
MSAWDHERRIRTVCNSSAWPLIADRGAEIELRRTGPDLEAWPDIAGQEYFL